MTLVEGPAAAPRPALAPIPIFDAAYKYADDVLCDRLIACKYVKQAARRFLNDLEQGARAGGLTFDAQAAQRIGDYAAGLRVELLDWQAFVLSNLFGFRNDKGLRRFRLAHEEVAKKNGKTTLQALIALYMVDPLGDGEPFSECYAAATTRYQSQDILFRTALRLRNENLDLAARSEAFKGSLVFGDNVFMPLASNSEKLQGRSMHCGVLDELADHPTAALHSTFTSSTVGRKQPLIISITTAGNQREGNVAWAVRQHALQVLDGSITDDSFFAFICTLDEGDRWDDETVWPKANPSLGRTVYVENLRELAGRAKALPSGKLDFARYNLNIWPSTTLSAWIDINDLSKPGCAFTNETEGKLPVLDRLLAAEHRLLGQTCYAGLDVALVDDLSVLCLLFPSGDIYEALFRIWLPEENIERRSKEHRVPYREWAEQGLLTVTPGDVTDFGWIEREVLAIRDKYWVKELGFDVAFCRDLAMRLQNHGMKVTQVRQGYGLHGAILRIEKLVKERKFCTHGHPVANWCFSNVVLDHGVREVRFNKTKSREKIDCATAAACAMDTLLANPPMRGPMVYTI